MPIALLPVPEIQCCKSCVVSKPWRAATSAFERFSTRYIDFHLVYCLNSRTSCASLHRQVGDHPSKPSIPSGNFSINRFISAIDLKFREIVSMVPHRKTILTFLSALQYATSIGQRRQYRCDLSMSILQETTNVRTTYSE